MIKYIQAFDLKTFQSISSVANYFFLLKSARAISKTADGWFYVLLIPLLCLFKPTNGLSYFVLCIGGFVAERAIYFVLKNSIKRKRPAESGHGFKSIIKASDEFSFPSGHTSAAFFFSTILCFGFSYLFAGLYIWAAAVGMSRIVLGVHFLTDVLMGALIGSTLALLIL